MINPSSSFFPIKKKQSYSLLFEQDAVFFGAEYIQSLLSEENSSDIHWYVNDGDCILKGQTCADFSENQSHNIENIFSILSYLSGVRTLARCYTEQLSLIPLVGSCTPDHPLQEWEKAALTNEGVSLTPKLSKTICSSLKEAEEVLKKEEDIIILNSTLPKEELKNILKTIPSSQTKGLYGKLLPKDLDSFQDLPFHFVFSEFLQGQFPSVKIKIHEI